MWFTGMGANSRELLTESEETNLPIELGRRGRISYPASGQVLLERYRGQLKQQRDLVRQLVHELLSNSNILNRQTSRLIELEALERSQAFELCAKEEELARREAQYKSEKMQLLTEIAQLRQKLAGGTVRSRFQNLFRHSR